MFVDLAADAGVGDGEQHPRNVKTLKKRPFYPRKRLQKIHDWRLLFHCKGHRWHECARARAPEASRLLNIDPAAKLSGVNNEEK